MASPGSAFLRESAHLLCDVYLPRLERAVAELRPADAWWRPHERATSVANLLLHLQGNVRQWILSGLAGAEDRRDRATEFAAREGSPLGPLLERLSATVSAAARVIEEFPEHRLTDPVRIQGFDTTGTSAIYHVVEHFSWHTGQIVWIAKERGGLGHRIGFYDEAVVNRARNPSP